MGFAGPCTAVPSRRRENSGLRREPDRPGPAAFLQEIGPLIGGALAGLIGASFALLVDVLSYVVDIVTLSLLGSAEPPHRRAATGSLGKAFLGSIVDVFRWIARHPLLWATTSSSALFSTFFAGLLTNRTLFLINELDASKLTIGVILGASALGGVTIRLFADALIERF
ncbi:MFS transporter [Amycolatopsis taiwanensis]|uniref:MFS transporter n=1 Tax=Amycolatopsis taiwanensis TaxID=342230 RepID=UPI000485B13A|nr:MFS transporter [Amycolatopsis taiwanensis]